MGTGVNPVDLAPARWAESMRRLAVVRGYATSSEGKRGAAGDAAVLAAAELGLSVRSFLRLVQAYRMMREGSVRPSRQGRHTDIDPRIDAIVNDVMSSKSRIRSQAAVIEAIRKRCEEEGLEAPSESTIRRRIGRSPVIDLSGLRIGEAVDFAMDSCATDLDVVGQDGPACAVLTILVDITTAAVKTHLLSVGEPGGHDLALMLETVAARPSDGASITIACAARLHSKLRHPQSVEGAFEFVAVPMRRGSLITRVLGSHLGKLAFRPHRRPENRIGEPVSLSDARSIVDAMMAGTSFA